MGFEKGPSENIEQHPAEVFHVRSLDVALRDEYYYEAFDFDISAYCELPSQ